MEKNYIREFSDGWCGGRPSYVQKGRKMTVKECVEALIDIFLTSKILGFTRRGVCSKAKNT